MSKPGYNASIEKQKELIRYTEGICAVLGPDSIINELLPIMKQKLADMEKQAGGCHAA